MRETELKFVIDAAADRRLRGAGLRSRSASVPTRPTI